MSSRGVGQPDWIEIASASGIAARTTSASAGVIFGRRCALNQSSSSSRPMLIGVRRTWNEFDPTIALAMFSVTYAFIPWITATTATRNATLTMMPTSVKNDRSGLALIWVNAVERTSAKDNGEAV